MNSRIVKFVAGAGKTTYSKRLMSRVKNGLYLAFTNSVIDDMNKYSFIAKTIDSLFISYIIPKFVKLIPIISSSSNIIFSDSSSGNLDAVSASNIVIRPNGDLLNRTKKIVGISLFTTNNDLHSMKYFQNLRSLQYIFGQEVTRFTHLQRSEISRYIIINYPNELVAIVKKRFQFVIIDEAQDISDYREDFCKLLFNSNIKVRLLGDDNQNINGGGKWFETLKADKVKKVTYRCSDKICNWIRLNLNIEIFGNANLATFSIIEFDDISNLDDGKRVLLYKGRFAKINSIIDHWSGKIMTIQSAKGMTLNDDIVIVGESLNKKFYYTAITRTTKSVFSTIKKIN